MKMNDVITIVAGNGTEYVGKFLAEAPETVTVGNPHIVTPDNGNLGFMPTVAMTGEPRVDQVTFNKSQILLVVKTAEEVAKEYVKSSSGIII